jgi:carbonic anhydrase
MEITECGKQQSPFRAEGVQQAEDDRIRFRFPEASKRRVDKQDSVATDTQPAAIGSDLAGGGARILLHRVSFHGEEMLTTG